MTQYPRIVDDVVPHDRNDLQVAAIEGPTQRWAILALAVSALALHSSCAPPKASDSEASQASIDVVSRQEETIDGYKIGTIFHRGGANENDVKAVFSEDTVDSYHFLYPGQDGQTITVDVQPAGGEPTPKDLVVETQLHEEGGPPPSPITWSVGPTNRGFRARAVFQTSPKVTRVESKVKAP